MTTSSTIPRLLLLTLCSLAPLGAQAGRSESIEPVASAADEARTGFFALPRSYPLRADAGPLWLEVADGITLLFDAGDNSAYNYVMQYDYRQDRVVNVVRYADSDHATILRSLDAARQPRPAVDHTGYGSRLRIRTPPPPPPPIGVNYWLEFVPTVKTTAFDNK